MTANFEELIGNQLLWNFVGKQAVPDFIASAIQKGQASGVTLFRHNNIDSAAQVKELIASLQALRPAGQPLLLIAADQEGGQLAAVGDATQFSGNMALGAAGSTDLARQVGRAMGLEMRAIGVNLNYAPCCDVNINPKNPVIGTRSFGEDPKQVGELAAALIEGLQSSGAAASAKHFPGHGDTASDSHHGAAVVPHTRERLEAVELPPFEQAIHAGVRTIMTAHLALPAITGREDLPSTLSETILKGLLRKALGFEGVIISDAMDMSAIPQGPGLIVDAICALQAGVDLLLLTARLEQENLYYGLLQAARRGLLDPAELAESNRRIIELRSWIHNFEDPPFSVVNCTEHKSLAAQLGQRSVTLVRDEAGILPLHLDRGARIAVILPRPADLTPADTSSFVKPVLAEALRRRHPSVEEFQIALNPSEAEISTLSESLAGFDLLIAGTINAFTHAGQAALVNRLLSLGKPVIAAALRMPYDLQEFPQAPTYLCTYSLLEPSLEALAAGLFGEAGFKGRLPVSIPGLYPLGYGVVL